MGVLFDIYKVDCRGPAIWLGSVHSYCIAALEIELSQLERRVTTLSLIGKPGSELS
jgi:hypothetical protein